MSLEFMTVAMFATLILAITLGHPLAYTLAAVATLFGLIDNGFSFPMLFEMFVNNAWGLMNNYTLVAIPLFILMAQILDRSKVSEALFESLYVVLGSVKGGLGLAVVVVCTVFAATTGIIGASVVAMGLLATPALVNKGYQKELTAGIICASGTLGILIPPSIMMVVYGGLTGLKETSVGNLFAGAIFPGLILAVMGTILAGVATPTEAAGLGALGALVLAFLNKKLNWLVLKESGYATLRTTSMIMMLFIGGKFFSTVFLSMGGGDVVADLLIGSGMNRWLILGVMMTIVFLMGMFIDWAAILLVTVPIFMPIAMELDFDPLWFSLLMCVNLQTSFLTPPFGYALFYFKGVAPAGYTMMHIYKGILPFVFLQIVSMAVLCLFPAVVTWLPGLFFGS